MIIFLIIGAVMLFCFGGLVGAAWTTQILGGVSRRHAAERRNLNNGWRAFEDARRARDESVLCARCHRELSEMSGLYLTLQLGPDDDDGT